MNLLDRLKGKTEYVTEKVAEEIRNEHLNVSLVMAHQAYVDATEKIAAGIEIEIEAQDRAVEVEKVGQLTEDTPVETLLQRLSKSASFDKTAVNYKAIAKGVGAAGLVGGAGYAGARSQGITNEQMLGYAGEAGNKIKGVYNAGVKRVKGLLPGEADVKPNGGTSELNSPEEFNKKLKDTLAKQKFDELTNADPLSR